LPGSLKIRERGKNLQNLSCRTSNWLPGCLERRRKVKYFWNFLAEHIFNLPGRIMWIFFVQNSSGFAGSEIPWEHMFSKNCSLAAFGLCGTVQYQYTPTRPKKMRKHGALFELRKMLTLVIQAPIIEYKSKL